MSGAPLTVERAPGLKDRQQQTDKRAAGRDERFRRCPQLWSTGALLREVERDHATDDEDVARALGQLTGLSQGVVDALAQARDGSVAVLVVRDVCMVPARL